MNDVIPIKFDDGEGNLLLRKMGKRGAKEAESEAEAQVFILPYLTLTFFFVFSSLLPYKIP